MGAPPSNQHRIEMLEKGLGDLRSTIVEQISVAVNGATLEMQQTLIEQHTKSVEQTTQLLKERLTRAKERQDTLLNVLKAEHDKFQAEVRSSMTSLKISETSQGRGHRNGKARGLNKEDGAESGRPGGFGFGLGQFGENRLSRINEFGSGSAFAKFGGQSNHGYSGGAN